MSEKLELLRQKREKIEMAGGQKRIDKQHRSGKLTARERMNVFFDEGTFAAIPGKVNVAFIPIYVYITINIYATRAIAAINPGSL